ncbi:LCP family protein [Lacisediminihabitans changchengi]|uniref:LCP family protein n=1 Tax=Lacisediminihabitans changchengi TaxID=2787634 RepID=A0A934SIV2_9MICO|nr:LCP family protein [Lacisediminihabitans changchengi]MBK4347451.1 LCP family protein [Lacisediminihabitans changchengi]
MPSRPQTPLARHGRLSHPRPLATAAKFVVAAIAVVAVSSAAVGAVAVYDLSTTVTTGGVKLIGQPVAKAPPGLGAYDGEINVLVAASDSAEGDPAYGKRGEHLNDVTMLLHVSADHQSATVVSFPRDLIIPIASCPNGKGGNYPAQVNKINVALTYGGLPCIVKTVENLTGMTIPFAALTEFQGVVGMSNAVGGVTVCIAKAIHDEQIHFDLEAGQQTLVGQDAVQFLRVRYGVGDGSDLARISNQQSFLSALVRKIKTPEVLGNPVKDYELAKAVVDNTKRSESLSNLTTMVSMALAVKDISFEDVVFVKYPSGYGTAAGQNGVLPSKAAADILFTALRNDQPIALTGGTGEGTTLDPNNPTVTSPTTPATTSAAPTDAATPAPSAVALPSSVNGQTAAQNTCTKGQRAKG